LKNNIQIIIPNNILKRKRIKVFPETIRSRLKNNIKFKASISKLILSVNHIAKSHTWATKNLNRN